MFGYGSEAGARERDPCCPVFTEARGFSVLEDTVDEADGGLQVVAIRVGKAGSCVNVGLAEATCRHGNRVSCQSSHGTCKGGVAMLSSRSAT